MLREAITRLIGETVRIGVPKTNPNSKDELWYRRGILTDLIEDTGTTEYLDIDCIKSIRKEITYDKDQEITRL